MFKTINKNDICFTILVIVVLSMIIAACVGNQTEASTESRFKIEWYRRQCQVITDTHTGVQYLFYKYSNGGGLCKLEEKEGY